MGCNPVGNKLVRAALDYMIDLAHYDRRSYDPSQPVWVQAAWFLVGLPILRCSILPLSSVRRWILGIFRAKIGVGVVIKPGVRIKYPWLLSVGDHSWLGEDCWIDNLAPVSLGKNVCISQGAYLCTGNHDWTDENFSLFVKPINIADGAWVCARAFVAPGVNLGEYAVLTAASVATDDIPPFHIHGGNPAKLLRVRHVRDHQHAVT